jgi:structural maintenance of chromosome 1
MYRMSQVEQKLQETLKECDKTRSDTKSLREKFLNVKQKRHDAFMKCFEHVSSCIDAIYKDLTKSRSYPTGGTAYLTLENTEVLFLQ